VSGMHIGLPPSHAYSEAFSVVWMDRAPTSRTASRQSRPLNVPIQRLESDGWRSHYPLLGCRDVGQSRCSLRLGELRIRHRHRTFLRRGIAGTGMTLWPIGECQLRSWKGGILTLTLRQFATRYCRSKGVVRTSGSERRCRTAKRPRPCRWVQFHRLRKPPLPVLQKGSLSQRITDMIWYRTTIRFKRQHVLTAYRRTRISKARRLT
jgi:hypothetical protein